jgi:hypothetical protein
MGLPEEQLIYLSQSADRYHSITRITRSRPGPQPYWDWNVLGIGRMEDAEIGAAQVRVPFWLPVSILGIAAIGLRPRPRCSFSLLDFLAATTFAALLAGLIAWLVRLPGGAI